MNHKDLSFFYRIDDQYAIFETSSSVRAIRWLLRTEVNTKNSSTEFSTDVAHWSRFSRIYYRLLAENWDLGSRMMMAICPALPGITPSARLSLDDGLLVHNDSRSSEACWPRLVVEVGVTSEISPEDWSFSIFPGRKCCRELFWTWALRWLIEIPRTGVVVAFFSWVWSMVLWWRCRRYRRSYRWIYRRK